MRSQQNEDGDGTTNLKKSITVDTSKSSDHNKDLDVYMSIEDKERYSKEKEAIDEAEMIGKMFAGAHVDLLKYKGFD